MGAVQSKIKAGALIDEAKWIKRSRLVFLEKRSLSNLVLSELVSSFAARRRNACSGKLHHAYAEPFAATTSGA